MSILIVLAVLGGIAMYMITKDLPKDNSKFSYTEEEDTEVLDLPKTPTEQANDEYQESINKFLEKGAKEGGITVEEYQDIVTKEYYEEEESRKARYSI